MSQFFTISTGVINTTPMDLSANSSLILNCIRKASSDGSRLVLLPELIYVKDIYSGDYKRANTMFKLTYQSYILFGIVMSYAIMKLICFSRTKEKRIFAWAALIVLQESI